MAALGFFLLERFWAGKLTFYINQRYIWLVLLAGFGLIGLALVTFNHRPPIWVENEGLLEPEMAPRHSRIQLFIFLVVLLFGFLIPETSLGASAAESRGVSSSIPLTRGGSIPETLAINPTSRSVLEWLWAYSQTDDPNSLIGQPVDVDGFIFVNAQLPDGYFMVGRFIITCCVADATAIGIAVLPEGDLDVPSGWVNVQGTMTLTDFNGAEALLIEADQIIPIDVPDQPYLYP